ncbi:MAG: AAA family ATPase [Clostridia bacterium]|nr:AAA family ATPase [Clostridia bacterium]
MDITKFTSYRDKIVKSCSKVIVGKDDAIELVLTCFICSGHVLLEDVPGTGKTMLLRSFAKTIGSAFKRIQFTPDLLPSDLTGINFYNQHTGQFEFRRGPLFANIILAEEINRATPRTQSSLLEAMEEKQISVDGSTMPLSEPFMVMATQNPIESYGTFPLPEAQTDRFFMRLKLGYMTREQELSVISRASTTDIIESLETVVTPEETRYLKENFRNIKVHDSVAGYMMDIIEGTRKDSSFITGVSTRGAIALYKASQVTAAFAGRDFVLPEDVKKVAPYVLAHRIVSGSNLSADDSVKFIENIISAIPVPLENK